MTNFGLLLFTIRFSDVRSGTTAQFVVMYLLALLYDPRMMPNLEFILLITGK